jgi:hypothetical protein
MLPTCRQLLLVCVAAKRELMNSSRLTGVLLGGSMRGEQNRLPVRPFLGRGGKPCT